MFPAIFVSFSVFLILLVSNVVLYNKNAALRKRNTELEAELHKIKYTERKLLLD